MSEEEIKERVMAYMERSIRMDLKIGTENGVDVYLKRAGRFITGILINEPDDDGIMPDTATINRFLAEIRPLVEKELFRQKCESKANKIGMANAEALIAEAFDQKIFKKGDVTYMQMKKNSDNIRVKIPLDVNNESHMEFTVHCNSSLMSDIDRLVEAFEEARSMIKKYGKDFEISKRSW